MCVMLNLSIEFFSSNCSEFLRLLLILKCWSVDELDIGNTHNFEIIFDRMTDENAILAYLQYVFQNLFFARCILQMLFADSMDHETWSNSLSVIIDQSV